MSHVAEGLQTALEHQEPEEGAALPPAVEDLECLVRLAVMCYSPNESETQLIYQRLNEYATALKNHGLNEPETVLAYQRLRERLDMYFSVAYPVSGIISESEREMLPPTGTNADNDRTNAYFQPISNQDTYGTAKLPEDYKDIIEWSKYDLQCETPEDLCAAFCRGFFLNDGEKWFSLDKYWKKCVTVSAREALEEDKWKWMPTFPTESRFGEVADYCNLPKFGIFAKFRSKLLSPQTTYGVYLVYKLFEGYNHVNPPPVLVVDKDSHPKEVHNIFLRTPQTPVISYNANNKALNPSNMPQMKGLPKQRSDGWMEVQVHEFKTRPTIKMVSARLRLSSYDMGFQGLTVQCLEFRPV